MDITQIFMCTASGGGGGGGTPVIESVGVKSSPTLTTSHTVAAPTGITDGDELVLIIACRPSFSTGAITLPSGFTLDFEAQETVGNTERLLVARKTASSESGDYTFTTAASGFIGAMILRISGFSSMSYTTKTDMAYGTTHTAPDLTTTGDALIVRCVARNRGSGSTLTTPSTEIAIDYGGTGTSLSQSSCGTSQEAATGAVAVGTADFTSISNCYSALATLAFYGA